MDKYIKNIIEETFKSKKQQRYFYAKAGDTDLPKKERKKWKKWSKEFSDKTDFKSLPEVAEEEKEVDEIVDVNGNIARNKIPETKDAKGASKKTTDQVVKTGAGQMGTHRVHGTHTSLRYWAEGEKPEKSLTDENDMSKTLGFKNTMGQDKPKKSAEKYFEKELGMDEPEAEERLNQFGYDDELPEDKVRLIENPKQYIQDYVESVLSKKTAYSDLVKKDQTEDIEKEIEPIIKKQISSLKNTLQKNNISIKDLINLLKKDDE